jgi:hypothetical protein
MRLRVQMSSVRGPCISCELRTGQHELFREPQRSTPEWSADAFRTLRGPLFYFPKCQTVQHIQLLFSFGLVI